MDVSGGCLRGAVRYRARGEIDPIGPLTPSPTSATARC